MFSAYLNLGILAFFLSWKGEGTWNLELLVGKIGWNNIYSKSQISAFCNFTQQLNVVDCFPSIFCFLFFPTYFQVGVECISTFWILPFWMVKHRGYVQGEQHPSHQRPSINTSKQGILPWEHFSKHFLSSSFLSRLQTHVSPGTRVVSSAPRRDFQILNRRSPLGCRSCLCGHEPTFTKTSFSSSFHPLLLTLSALQWSSYWPGLTEKRLDVNKHVAHSKEAWAVLLLQNIIIIIIILSLSSNVLVKTNFRMMLTISVISATVTLVRYLFNPKP